MKTKILLFFTILYGIHSYSQGETYYELQGRSEGKKALMKLAEATNNSTFEVYFVPDNTIGTKYKLTLIHSGEEKYSNSFNVSTTLLPKLNKHVDKPGAGEQILGLCINQARAMQKVFREGLNLNLLSLDADCNCPPDTLNSDDLIPPPSPRNERTLLIKLDNYNRNLGGLNSNTNYDLGLNRYDQKTKTWFGRNWGWVIPLGIAIISGTTYLIVESSGNNDVAVVDPDDPGGPGHNDNAFVFRTDKVVKNLALDNGNFIPSSGGFVLFTFN